MPDAREQAIEGAAKAWFDRGRERDIAGGLRDADALSWGEFVANENTEQEDFGYTLSGLLDQIGAAIAAYEQALGGETWTCEHGSEYGGSEDYISGARNAHGEFEGHMAAASDRRSVNDIALDILAHAPECEQLVEEWFATTNRQINEGFAAKARLAEQALGGEREPADEYMAVDLLRCGQCGGVSSKRAWDKAWRSERSRRMGDKEAIGEHEWSTEPSSDYGLDERDVCPRCQYVHSDNEESWVEEVAGHAALPRCPP